MSKNIVICCDGTADEFGSKNSNAIKPYQTMVCDAAQIAYYHPGVGTMGARSALTRFGRRHRSTAVLLDCTHALDVAPALPRPRLR